MASPEDRIRMLLQEQLAKKKREEMVRRDPESAKYMSDEEDLAEYRKFEKRNGYIQKLPADADAPRDTPRNMPGSSKPTGKGPCIKKM